MNFTTYKDFFQSKLFRRILCGLGIVIIALTIFQAGIFVGYRKASFSYRLGDNYHRTFGMPAPGGGIMNPGSPFGLPGGEFTSSYGTTGTIVKINLPTIIVAGTDKVEKVITVDQKTIIRHFRDDVKVTDLKVGDGVVVIGSPDNSAQIKAELIRVLPSIENSNESSAPVTSQTN